LSDKYLQILMAYFISTERSTGSLEVKNKFKFKFKVGGQSLP